MVDLSELQLLDRFEMPSCSISGLRFYSRPICSTSDRILSWLCLDYGLEAGLGGIVLDRCIIMLLIRLFHVLTVTRSCLDMLRLRSDLPDK